MFFLRNVLSERDRGVHKEVGKLFSKCEPVLLYVCFFVQI